MKTERKIFIAFILNLFFAVFEFFGGVATKSTAIMSDALHDLGDAISIGLSWQFERKSKKTPDNEYSYGYGRYSVLGGVITTLILVFGSILMILNAKARILNPVKIDYDKMIVFAVLGVIVNFVAAYLTHRGDSINQKAVNLHMLEDVLGWFVVLIGAVVMRFTDFYILDPILSIIVAAFILFSSLKNLKEAAILFLEKTPSDISISKIKEDLLAIQGVEDVHHIHIRSIDGKNNYATMHIVSSTSFIETKEKVRTELKNHNIKHSTLELETPEEDCPQKCGKLLPD